jgi:hypothetical protein
MPACRGATGRGKLTDRQTDGRAGRQTGGETDRQRQTDGRTDGRIDGQTERTDVSTPPPLPPPTRALLPPSSSSHAHAHTTHAHIANVTHTPRLTHTRHSRTRHAAHAHRGAYHAHAAPPRPHTTRLSRTRLSRTRLSCTPRASHAHATHAHSTPLTHTALTHMSRLSRTCRASHAHAAFRMHTPAPQDKSVRDAVKRQLASGRMREVRTRIEISLTRTAHEEDDFQGQCTDNIGLGAFFFCGSAFTFCNASGHGVRACFWDALATAVSSPHLNAVAYCRRTCVYVHYVLYGPCVCASAY